MAENEITICMNCYTEMMTAKRKNDEILAALSKNSTLTSIQRAEMARNPDFEKTLMRGKLIQIASIFNKDFKL